MNIFICGGPFSLCTLNVTVNFRFSAISCTKEIGDFNSDADSSSLDVDDSLIVCSSVVVSGVSGFKTISALVNGNFC
jgi:hypothetical protein